MQVQVGFNAVDFCGVLFGYPNFFWLIFFSEEIFNSKFS